MTTPADDETNRDLDGDGLPGDQPTQSVPAQGPFLVETPRRTSNHALARGRELLGLLLLVLIADLLIYRGEGYSGFAAFLVLTLPLLFMARPKADSSPRPIVSALMAILVIATAVRVMWLGHVALILVGLVLLAGWARAVSGRVPYVVDTVVQTFIAPLSGICVAHVYRYLLSRPPTDHTAAEGDAVTKPKPRGLLLPIVTVLTFGTFFVLANPVLQEWIRETLSVVSTQFVDLIAVVMPDFAEIFFWVVTLAAAIGFVRPLLQTSLIDSLTPVADDADQTASSAEHVYASFRNTLIAVTVLFAGYLAFEFITLWRRDFPEGFYYAGYAHSGAAWLTVALAAASALLSAMFRGSMLADDRLPVLKRIAWIWSAENFLLAIAVVNRLLIYVDFNGMTRMRVVGFLGIAAVASGFVLVVIKIARTKSFGWLIHGDFFVVAAAVVLFLVLPVDRMVHAYNTQQILAGDLAPSVQITEHPSDLGGYLSMIPLLNCDDEIIRHGVAAMLFSQVDRVTTVRTARTQVKKALAHELQDQMLKWTSYQHAKRQFLERMASLPTGDGEQNDDSFTALKNSEVERAQAFEAFKKYAYQWY